MLQIAETPHPKPGTKAAFLKHLAERIKIDNENGRSKLRITPPPIKAKRRRGAPKGNLNALKDKSAKGVMRHYKRKRARVVARIGMVILAEVRLGLALARPYIIQAHKSRRTSRPPQNKSEPFPPLSPGLKRAAKLQAERLAKGLPARPKRKRRRKMTPAARLYRHHYRHRQKSAEWQVRQMMRQRK